MDLQFSLFYEMFGLLVAYWLYGSASFFTAVRSLKFWRLRLKADFDIIVKLEDIDCVAKRLRWGMSDKV